MQVQEYSLGKFTKEMFDDLVVEEKKVKYMKALAPSHFQRVQDLEGGITRHPPTKKIEGMNMPYHEVILTPYSL